MSMQARPLEEAAAFARLDANVHGLAVAINGQRDFDTGFALRPNLAEKARQIAHLLAGDRKHNIAVAQVRFLGRATISDSDDHESAFHLRGVQAEPRS